MRGGNRGAAPTVRAMSDVDAFAVRACTEDDVGTVLALVKADEERVCGRPSRLVAGDIRDWWQSIDLVSNSWLLTDPRSRATAGVVWLDRQGTELGVGYAIADPAYGNAVPALVDLVERRSTELDLQRLHVPVLMPDPPVEKLLADRGYRDVRRFFEMAVQLDGPPPAIELPDGSTLQVATPEDGPAFHDTIDEAFQDHWEHHPLPFDEWWRQRTGDPEF